MLIINKDIEASSIYVNLKNLLFIDVPDGSRTVEGPDATHLRRSSSAWFESGTDP